MTDVNIFSPDFYYSVVWIMLGLAVVVFVALQRVSAGYGMMYSSRKCRPSVGNRAGWVLMESPVFSRCFCSGCLVRADRMPHRWLWLSISFFIISSVLSCFLSESRVKAVCRFCHSCHGYFIQSYKRVYDRRVAVLCSTRRDV